MCKCVYTYICVGDEPTETRRRREEKRRGKGKIRSNRKVNTFFELFFKKRKQRERERHPSSKKPHLIVNVRDVFVAVDVIQSLLPGFF